MRYVLIVLGMLIASVNPAVGQVSVGIGISTPGLSIGINLPAYPTLVPVPGYPVYYAPRAEFELLLLRRLVLGLPGDNWYASTWYNGPWSLVDREVVPLFILRIPVRYYRPPPAYFRGWRPDAPPRWGEHWGRDWEQRRSGWDKWNRKAVRRRRRVPPTSGSIPGIATPARRSGSARLKGGITATSRATP